MKLSFLFYTIVVLLAVSTVNSQESFDCGNTNSRPRFTSLAVFPNPARVEQLVHVQAKVQLSGIKTGDIKDGELRMEIKLKGVADPITLAGIPLCDASSAIVCSRLEPGENKISFDYMLPKIPAGTYTITLRVYPNVTTMTPGCLTFDLTVIDPAADTKKYVSWIQAELAGETQFEHDDYMKRTLGEIIQVGPLGNAYPVLSYTFPWGTFLGIQGSGDLIAPSFDTGGYVWGLTGHMTQMTYQSTKREHVYEGEFYVGYVRSLAQRTLDAQILTGTFILTWNIAPGADGVVTSNLTGIIDIQDDVELPLGFSNPILVARLDKLSVTTNNEGTLLLMGSNNICLGDSNCNAPIDQTRGRDNDLDHWEIGLIVGVLVGLGLIAAVIVSLFKWRSRSKRYEEEEGIFSPVRKPEYGNALVVDDIIQETREHSPNMVPALSRGREQDFSDSESDYTHTSRTRSRSRTPDSFSDRSRTPSRSRSRSAAGRQKQYSDSESDYSDAGSSASRA